MKSLTDRMREQRMVWVELDSTHSVRILPPTDLQVMESISEGGKVFNPSNIGAMVHDWKGFSEEDFLGKGIGSTDPIPLDREALNELLANNVDWVQTVILKLNEALTARGEARDKAAKK
jgi:hypothetical protein